MWKEDHKVHQSKVASLTKKARDCSTHNMCAKISKLMSERFDCWTRLKEKKCMLDPGLGAPVLGPSPGGKDLSSSRLMEKKSVLDPGLGAPVLGPSPGCKDLSSSPQLHTKFLTKTQDLVQLNKEEEDLLVMSLDFNRNLECDNNVAVDEVVITGNVNLTEDEKVSPQPWTWIHGSEEVGPGGYGGRGCGHYDQA